MGPARCSVYGHEFGVHLSMNPISGIILFIFLNPWEIVHNKRTKVQGTPNSCLFCLFFTKSNPWEENPWEIVHNNDNDTLNMPSKCTIEKSTILSTADTDVKIADAQWCVG